MSTERYPLGVVVCALVGFLAVLAAWTYLTATGHDAAGLVSAVVTLAGVGGLGAHVEHRTRQQNVRLAKIDGQTNGVLDARIEKGTTKAVRKVLRDAGYNVPPDPIED